VLLRAAPVPATTRAAPVGSILDPAATTERTFVGAGQPVDLESATVPAAIESTVASRSLARARAGSAE
jgi:hypothetical protein